MLRRRFLEGLAQTTGGWLVLGVAPAHASLVRVNTARLAPARRGAARAACGEDVCTTADACETGDAGHTCTTQDVCDTDASGDCTGDRCVADTSGDCTNDGGPGCSGDETCGADLSGACQLDSSDDCTNDGCAVDGSALCDTDRCVSDDSGACTRDAGPGGGSEECPHDLSGSALSDKSGGCTDDGCVSDKSGECTTDGCVSDSSGECAADGCREDSSKGCESDTCRSDPSGECTSDRCRSDSSGACEQDGGPASESCLIDWSGECTADASGDCAGDACVSDKSGPCTTDGCVLDRSGGCEGGDTCISDESGVCGGDSCTADSGGDCPLDRCVADASTGACLVADVCASDASAGCESDLCRSDGGTTDCAVRDTCALDLVSNPTESRRAVTRASLDAAVRWLYQLGCAALVVAAGAGAAGADTVIDARGLVATPTPTYATGQPVSVPAPVGPFLRDCDGDEPLEADVNGDGQCAGDPELLDTDGDGSRNLPAATPFTGSFQFTCFHVPDDVALVATGPLEVKASKELAVLGALRLPQSAALSTPVRVDARTSAWLAEGAGATITLTTALAGDVATAQTLPGTFPSIPFFSICGPVVFRDGFESGGVEWWPGARP